MGEGENELAPPPGPDNRPFGLRSSFRNGISGAFAMSSEKATLDGLRIHRGALPKREASRWPGAIGVAVAVLAIFHLVR